MLTEREQRLITAIQSGFPLTARPFFAIGLVLGLSETEVLDGLRDLQAKGIIKRVGVVVHHHELGYQANAMAVWDLPDDIVAEVGKKIINFSFVSLSYLRRRSLPEWPYNFYCMIHGREREETLRHADLLTQECGLASYARQILFSRRRFKQCGAQYFNTIHST